jgi:hypothetical protein
MQTRIPLWSIPVLSLILVLGCTAQQNDPVAAPPDKVRALGIEGDTTLMSKPFSDEVFVLVSVAGNTFTTLPDHVVVHDPGQKVTWFAEDPDVEIEITFRPDKGKDVPPGVTPPGKPCPAKARTCGGNPIGGRPGMFHYAVSGTKAGQPLDPQDPVLEILP